MRLLLLALRVGERRRRRKCKNRSSFLLEEGEVCFGEAGKHPRRRRPKATDARRRYLSAQDMKGQENASPVVVAYCAVARPSWRKRAARICCVMVGGGGAQIGRRRRGCAGNTVARAGQRLRAHPGRRCCSCCCICAESSRQRDRLHSIGARARSASEPCISRGAREMHLAATGGGERLLTSGDLARG